MAENTGIEWADDTINPWWGCTKVSPGCTNCYAEKMAHRQGVGWGPGAARDPRKHWKKTAHRLNRRAEREGRRRRVFCLSMGDWLDPEVPAEWLAELLEVVKLTPHLDWLLLTKRPELWRDRLAAVIHGKLVPALESHAGQVLAEMWLLAGRAPENIWVGVTVEDQQRADERVPALLAIPARVRFLSCEPLLGTVDLGSWVGTCDCHPCGARFWHDGGPGAQVEWEDDPPAGRGARMVCPRCGHDAGETGEVGMREPDDANGIHWVICGGESGPDARPMHPDWARSLRDQCEAAEVPFLFKQWGRWAPSDALEGVDPSGSYELGELFQKHCPAHGQLTCYVRCDPTYRVGKKKAGRVLDGRTWDEVPALARPTSD